MYLERVNRDREQMNMDEAQMSTDELQDNIGWSTRDYMNAWHVNMDEAQVVGFGTMDGFQTGQLMAKYRGETYVEFFVDPTGWRI